MPAADRNATEPRAVIRVRMFLTMHPFLCVADPQQGQERGVIVAGEDTSGVLTGRLSARWLGPEALQFIEDHRAELKPGRCLDLDIYHIKPAAAELRARIKSCAMAPLAPSWIKHEEKLQQSQQPEKQSA